MGAVGGKQRGRALVRALAFTLTLSGIGPALGADPLLPAPAMPRDMDMPGPVLDIPLPEAGAEEEVFKGFRVPPKRERVPDDSRVEVKQLRVKRLIPIQQFEGKCAKTERGFSCDINLKDAALQQVLDKVLEAYRKQFAMFDQAGINVRLSFDVDCTHTEYGEFCAVPVRDEALDQLLKSVLHEYGNQFSIFDLEDVSVRVTNFFRERDRILDTAFLPPQEVEDASVEIHLLEGRIGKVEVKGNHRYEPEVLLKPFDKLAGEPVTRNEITQSLLNVWDYPGLRLAERRAQLTFFPDEQVGKTALELEVFEEKYPFNLSLSLDNSGSEYSGIYRGRLTLDWNNPTGIADRLSASLLNNANPSNGRFYSLDYMRPVFTPDYHFGVGASRNQFELGKDLESFEIDGVTEQVYLSLDRVFWQTFRERFAASVGFARKDAETRQGGTVTALDKLAVLNFGVDYLSSDEWLSPSGRSNQLRLTAGYSRGIGGLFGAMKGENAPDSSRTGGSRANAGGNFDKLVFGAVRKQQFFADTTLWLRMNGQYSPDLLVSLEQMTLGGPNSVRAYPTAEFLRDSGYFLSLEWESSLPFFEETAVPSWIAGPATTTWGRAITLSVFVDHAGGWLNDPLANEEETVTFSGAGFGLGFNTSRFSMNMSLAKPIGHREPSNEKDPQFYVNMLFQLF
jgi:hemolysin activation/secretion protein